MISPTRLDRPGTSGVREFALLACAARTRPEASNTGKIKELLAAGIDWDVLLDLASRNQCTPLLYWQLDAACPELVPPEHLADLREHFQSNTRRNLMLTGELFKILDMLEEQGIRAVPYKGPALAVRCYGHLGLREFSDLDILVHPEDARAAEKLLVEAGFLHVYRLEGGHKDALFKYGSDMALHREPGDVRVELHWEVLTRRLFPRLDNEAMWRRMERAPISGRELSTISAEDNLVFLCAHGTKHAWERLHLVCDVAEQVRAGADMDWAKVVRIAGEQGCGRMLSAGLLLARNMLGAEVPAAVAKEAEGDRTAVKIAQEAAECLSGDETATEFGLEQSRFIIRATGGAGEKLKLLAYAFTFPTFGEWEIASFPEKLSWMYWMLRPVRLVAKYARALFEGVLVRLRGRGS